MISANKIRSVLLLGTESILVLPVVRALGSALSGQATLHTLSAGNGELNIPKFSKYICSHHSVRASNEEEFFEELLKVIKETKATMVIPVDEKYVYLLSVLKPGLREHVHLPPLPEAKVFESLINKSKLNALLSENQFPCAKTFGLSVNPADLEDDFFPCLLKPVRGSSGNGIKEIPDRNFLARCKKNVSADEYIIQEHIPGVNIDCNLLAENGEIKAYTVQRGLENRGFGFYTAIRFEKDKPFMDVVEELISRIGYSGVANLDYRLDERDGQYKLIDFNGRFWVSLLGSRAAGVDFSLLYCLSAMNISFDVPDFNEMTYLMGKSTFNYYRKKVTRLNLLPGAEPTSTDLWERISDPLPEFFRFSTRLFPRDRPARSAG